MKKMNKIISKRVMGVVLATSVAMGGIILGSTTVAKADTTRTRYTEDRVFGADRIETAIKIAEKEYPNNVDNVVLTTGYDFPDALSGSVLANKLGAPILLVSNTDMYANVETTAYIETHLRANGTVYVLGGKNEVSDSVADIPNCAIIRYGGDDKYDTNVAVNGLLEVKTGTPIVLATGEDFADALSISSIAVSKGYPIVLTEGNSLPQQEQTYLENEKPTEVYIVGGVGAVSDTVKMEVEIAAGLNDSNVVRISGSDRYNTSLEIAKYFNLNSDTAVIATGENYPDALAGSILAAKNNAPIILLDSDSSIQKDYLEKSSYNKLLVLGGTGVVSDATIDSLCGSDGVDNITPVLPAIENDWTAISPNVPRRLYDYPYNPALGTVITNKGLANLYVKDEEYDPTFKGYGDSVATDTINDSKKFIDAMYNNTQGTIDINKILYYYNGQDDRLYQSLSDSYRNKNYIHAYDVVSSFVNDRKQYNVSSEASFISDKTLSYDTDMGGVLRGTIRIKFDSTTDQAYLDKLGVKPNIWYDKDIEICWVEKCFSNSIPSKWTYYPYNTVQKINELSRFIVSDNQ